MLLFKFLQLKKCIIIKEEQMPDKIIDIIKNKKARFDYEILDTFEAGIALVGTEVKSIRMKKVSIQESYARIKNGEIFLVGMNINVYDQGNRFNHEPVRDRKLLLHKHEIKRLTGKLQEKGYTLVPMKMYIKNGKVKVQLGLGRGKAKYDKRKAIQKRDMDREIQREMKKYK
jgi:SsrA-binding protein